MQLSKLTFSLASLVFLFAFLVLPTMAHDLNDTVDGDQATAGDTTVNQHDSSDHLPAPMVESVELVDLMTAGGSTVSGDHVTLVANLTDDPLVAADGDTAAGVFQVKITFSDHLYTAADETVRITTVPLTVTAAARSASSNDLFADAAADGAISVAITGVPDDTDTADVDESVQSKVFFATFTVGLSLFGGQTADTADLPIDVWVTVDADAGVVPGGLVDGTLNYRTGNTASMRKMFTIVDSFPVDLMATAPERIGIAADDEIVVNLGSSAPSDLEAADFTVMAGTAAITGNALTLADDKSTLTITVPGTPTNTTVTVEPSEDGMAKISFDRISVEVDRTRPMVTVGDPTPAAPMAGQEVMVAITPTGEADNAAIVHSEVSVSQTPTGGTAADLPHELISTATGVSVTFTPTAAGEVTVTVAANAVMDEVGNGNAEAMSDPAITVAAASTDPVAVMAMPAATTVNGSTAIVVTLTDTDNDATTMLVPDDLMAGDFSVMEGTTALVPVVGDKDATTGTVTLTITPAGTGDTNVTVNPSDDADITFTEVSVMVDRTGPAVMFSDPTPAAPRAASEVSVTISVADDATQGAIALEDITVRQTDTDGNQIELTAGYNTTTKAVTFTPTVESTVVVIVDPDVVMDAVDNGNAETPSSSITVAAARVPVAVTATPAAATVDGSTDIVVTLTDTDNDAATMLVPSDLMAADFSVMEGTTALTPVVGAKDATAGTVTLTITPDAAGTGDTTVTVNPSTAGMAKITFAEVSVMVDRTAPMVAFSPVTGAKADAPVMVTITVTGADTGEAIAVGDISVVQTPASGDAKGLEHTYNATTRVVTFTPDAASTVTVTVAANAVMDAVGNGNAEAMTSIPVAAADAIDATAPTVTIAAGPQSGRTLPITITATDAALASDATIADSEVTVTGGTKSAITAANPLTFDVTTNYDVTTVTVAVAAGAVADTSGNMSAAKTMDFTVTAVSAPVGGEPTDAENILSGLSIPAETYIIIARSDVVGLPSNVHKVTWNGMPDLEDLFFKGGTLNVTRAKAPKVDHDGDDANDDGKKDADTTKNASAKIDIGARHIVITEVMAALNTAKPGTPGEIAHQWIEVYNTLKVEVTGITVSTKAGRPDGFPAGAPTDQVLLDRLSNVVDVGWTFANKLGQNGFDIDPAVAQETDVPFVSFYRNNPGEPGWQENRWTTSSEDSYMNHKGTPGAKERSGVAILATDTLNQKPAVINEVGNFPTGNKKYEWIEILVTEGNQRFKNWELEAIEGVDKIKRIVTLPEIPDAQKIGPGKVLLVTNADPANDPDHPLAVGFNVMKAANNQARGVSADHPVKYLVKAFDNELPSGDFVLTLRTRNDKDNQEGLVDVAGYRGDLRVVQTDNKGYVTGLWPLRNFGAPASDKNKLAEGAVHYRQHTSVPGTGTTHGDKKDDQVAMRDAAWTGVGYKRNADATAQNGGTPGYPNNALKSEGADVQNPVIISEIMFDNTRNFTQWIELHNTSKVHGMNIDNWSIFIVNHNLTADNKNYSTLSERIDLDGRIPPGQTYLIVSRRGSSNTKLPEARIHSAKKGRLETMLNPYGFQVTLKAKTNKAANEHQTIDTAGNLGVVPENNRRADAQSFEPLAWMLPDGTNESGNRVSINRVGFKKGVTAMNMDAASAGRIDGTKEIAWIRFDMSAQISLGNYYGHDSDKGSPGYTTGGVLPVSLSKFRPERLATGEVVVRWITESELNNAGFNILRSDTRDGEFTKINTQLIKGHGTTSERNTYEFTDTSAKPNVVYYYQIQDVSFDGDVTTLRTTHLRGNVSAAGKLTTTWGLLKSQD